MTLPSRMQPHHFGKRLSLRFCAHALIASLAIATSVVHAADPAAYQAALASGKNKLETGEVADAWREFQRAVQADNTQSEGYFYLAVASFRLGDHAAALEYGNAAVAAASEREKPRAVQLVEAIRKAKDTEEFARLGDEAQDNGLNAKAADLYSRAFQLSPDRGDLAFKAATLYAKRLNRLLDAAVLFQGAIASGDADAADAASAELGALHTSLQQLYKHELPRAVSRGDLATLVQLSQAFPIEVQPRLEVASLHAAKSDGPTVASWLGQAVKLGAGFDAVKERATFLDLWGTNDATFKTFIADAFGPSAVSEMDRRTKEHQARQLEEFYKIKINTVKKHLLSGPFNLDMGAAAFRSLHRSRLTSFKTNSAIIQRFQKEVPQTLEDWIEFPVGFVVPASFGGDERAVLDHNKLIEWDNMDAPPYIDAKTDGRALRDYVNHLSSAGLKPFLGLGEDWRLVDASLHGNDVYSLTFATTLKSIGSANDAIKRLTDVFGALQPFKGAPKGYLEYAANDALQGGRFFFPRANGITFDGRIFRTKENLADAPWILELRVSRMAHDTALFHEHYSVNAQKYSYAPFSKRFAEQDVRETLQAAAGLKITIADRDCVLEKSSFPFSFYDTDNRTEATLSLLVRDTRSGEQLLVNYYDVALASVEDIDVERAQDAQQAWAHNLRLTRPARLVITCHVTVKDAETGETEDQEDVLVEEDTRKITFYSRSFTNAYRGAIIAALPPPHKLESKDDAHRIARVFGYEGLFDSRLYRFLEEADRLGKFDDPLFLGKLAPSGAKPAFFARAAKAGNVRAMVELREYYKDKWISSSGTDNDREQAFLWAARAADAGDVASMQFMINEAPHRDLLATERWMKALQANGEWQKRYDVELERQITRRAELLRTLAPLSLEAKVRAFTPPLEPSRSGEIEGSVIGQKFKIYATPEKQYAPTEKSYTDRSGKKVKLYQRGQPVYGGPQQVWVNRKGIIIGEYYLLDHGKAAAKFAYDEHLASFTQYFGAQNLTDVSGGGILNGVAVKTKSKTIELLRFEKHAYLRYIDHTQE